MEYVYEDNFGTMGIEEYEGMEDFIELAAASNWRLPRTEEFFDEHSVDAEFDEVWPYVLEHSKASYLKADSGEWLVTTIQWTSDGSAGTDVEMPCYMGAIRILYPYEENVPYWNDPFILDVVRVYVPEQKNGEWLEFENYIFEDKILELFEHVFEGTELA